MIIRAFKELRVRARSVIPMRCRALLLTIACLVGGLTRAHAACVGDCDASGDVAINELVIGVNIALASQPIDACPSFACQGGTTVPINCLIQAVNNALGSCGEGCTVMQGLQALAGGNLIAARDCFATAAAANPDDGGARLYALFTRLGVELVTDQRLLAMLDANGAHLEGTVEHACSFKVTGPVVVPATAPRLDMIVDATRDIFGPRLTAAIEGLQSAIDANTAVPLDVKYFPPCVKPPVSLPVLDVDRGDFMAGRALLRAIQALIDLGGAYHLEIGLYDLIKGPPIEQLVTADPNLFTLESADRLASARDTLDIALDEAIAAVGEMRDEQDPQDDDLLIVMPEDAADADRLMQLTSLIRQSLHGEVVIPAQEGLPRNQRLNLSRFFDGSFPSLRNFVRFDAHGDLDLRHFPDPTFGGIAPDLTQADIDQLIDGGPLCAVCESDDQCAGLGPRRLYCGSCFLDCTGTVMRCSNGFTQCMDGVFF